ncbi:Sideroflexin-5 [Hondaea fermentalgiana]|uniref:Sideroflexin-5 n=1 Tax=Hondaea fermentalgiana TaxID=2315210 RepID=A0A2R5GB23_9STRA|nr:Sideroflexin-5 [Hondaea fermentalgiana]|eukprot:GBG25311.1 Sideroflexin-5 [Hondaea fermentalgiana]
MLGVRSIMGASAAAAVGVVSVATVAKTVEEKFPAPKFSLQAERFDLSTMQGRFAKQLTNCDPSLLLAREQEIRAAEGLLRDFSEGKAANASNSQLWSARKLVEATVQPDTKEIIPRPFRMSGYVPFNGPVCVAMMASQSTPALLFWNWVNQSQNALVNYFNRNASSPTSNETLFISYSAAVGAALTMAFGLSQFISRRYSPARAAQLMKFVAFPSSVVASCSNCYIMRRPEIESGISILDKDGNTLADGARSSVAANKAVMETVLSRGILQIPVFFIPPLLMSIPPFSAASAAVAIPLTTMFTIASFGFGLPSTVAIFPQVGSVKVEELEPELREAVGSQPDGTVYYNKGL